MVEFRPYRLIIDGEELKVAKFNTRVFEHRFELEGWYFFLRVGKSLLARDPTDLVFEYCKEEDIRKTLLDLQRKGAVLTEEIKNLFGLNNGILQRVNSTPVRMVTSGSLYR